MSRTRNRYKRKKIEKSAQDLISFFSQALYQHTPRLRRAMRLEELEEEVAVTSDYFVSWLEARERQEAAQGYNPGVSTSAKSSHTASSQATDNPAERAYFYEQMRMMAEIGTGIWRMRRELSAGNNNLTQEQLRLPNRYLMGVWDRMSEAGFSIQDYTGQAEEAKERFFLIPQEMDSFSSELPGIETIKPAIYYHNKHRSWQIQVGNAIDRRAPIV